MLTVARCHSIEYWFRCMDLDGDGVLSMFELEYFYEEQCRRLDSMAIEALPFEDCLCQMLDLVKPQSEGDTGGRVPQWHRDTPGEWVLGGWEGGPQPRGPVPELLQGPHGDQARDPWCGHFRGPVLGPPGCVWWVWEPGAHQVRLSGGAQDTFQGQREGLPEPTRLSRCRASVSWTLVSGVVTGGHGGLGLPALAAGSCPVSAGPGQLGSRPQVTGGRPSLCWALSPDPFHPPGFCPHPWPGSRQGVPCPKACRYARTHTRR